MIEAPAYHPIALAVSKILGELSAVSYPRSRALDHTEIVQRCDPTSKAIALGQLVCSLCQLKGAGCTGLKKDEVEISLRPEKYQAVAELTNTPWGNDVHWIIIRDEQTGHWIKVPGKNGEPYEGSDRYTNLGTSLCTTSPVYNEK